MIKVENINTWGFEHAIRGMRNPMNSWSKSDSDFANNKMGENDLDLARRLYKAGPEHRKFLRQVYVSMDITAPDYFYKEFSTYKVGVVENSTSTMHRIHSKEFTLDDFSTDHLEDFSWNRLDGLIVHLNMCRDKFLETKDKSHWWQIIQLLPMSYNYRRTITMNYENVINMINQRTGHKLDEWNDFVKVLSELPYIKEITQE